MRWRKPAGGKRRPGVIDATRAELVRGLEMRQGQLWWRVARTAIIAGYSIARALDRVRGLRKDGAESLLAMTVALLYLADVRTGFIGKPRPGGGRWQRYTLRDLCQLAFGGQGEAELRRGRRALDVMTSLGWIAPTKQVRRHLGDGAFVSEAAVRRLNLDRLCSMTGTSWLLAKDRRHADRHTPTRPEATQQGQKPPQSRQERPLAARRPEARGTSPPATGEPPRAGIPQHVLDIIKRL